jgi:hypothetical protein
MWKQDDGSAHSPVLQHLDKDVAARERAVLSIQDKAFLDPRLEATERPPVSELRRMNSK